MSVRRSPSLTSAASLAAVAYVAAPAACLGAGLSLALAACGENLHAGRLPPPKADPATIALVESAPVETTLDHPDIPNASETWVEMIDGARSSIDFAEFYASQAEGKDLKTSKLTPVIAAVERAVKRGVKVRFLADSVFAHKYPETLDRLGQAGVQVRIITFSAFGGGVLHAKYFVVDGTEAFVGSQNFDWRSLAHIQEMGVRVHSPVIAGELLDILETDWELAGGAAPDARVRRRWSPLSAHDIVAQTGEHVTLLASPRNWLPLEAAWELPKLIALIDGATRTIDVQVLTFKAKERDGSPFPMLDDALRRAAERGVRVRLLVSDWSSKPGSDERQVLESLSRVPNVEVRVITIPPFSGGDIPYARVAHAKYMIVDAATPAAKAWVGTSNWEGDYFTKSRDVAIVLEGGQAPKTLERVYEDGFGGAYAKAVAPSAPGASGASSAVTPPSAGSPPAASSARPSSSGPARP